MPQIEDRAPVRGLLSDLLASCGADGVAALTNAEILIDRIARSDEESLPCT